MVRELAQFTFSRLFIGVSALLVSSFVVFAGLYLPRAAPPTSSSVTVRRRPNWSPKFGSSTDWTNRS